MKRRPPRWVSRWVKTYQMIEGASGRAIPITVAGIWSPADPSDFYWSATTISWRKLLLVTDNVYRLSIEPEISRKTGIAVWYLSPDEETLYLHQADSVANGLRFVPSRADLRFPRRQNGCLARTASEPLPAKKSQPVRASGWLQPACHWSAAFLPVDSFACDGSVSTGRGRHSRLTWRRSALCCLPHPARNTAPARRRYSARPGRRVFHGPRDGAGFRFSRLYASRRHPGHSPGSRLASHRPGSVTACAGTRHTCPARRTRRHCSTSA